MLRELIEKSRSYRRFDEKQKVEHATLESLVGLARLTPSAANLQPLRYLLSSDTETNAKIFSHLKWAGYLTGWPGPAEGERPTAYIIILLDTWVSTTIDCDHGIAAQTIMLGAAEAGLGGCIISAIEADALAEELGIPHRYKVLLAIALGKPVEKVSIEPADPGGSVRYWRDSEGVHHVPKRSLRELILKTASGGGS